jgi:hypothetical protein
MTEPTNPLLRKPVFTTKRKKSRTTINISSKGSICKEKCRQLTEQINHYFSSGIVHDDDLTTMIEDYIGADKETIRAYKGYSGHIRQGRCGDNRIVGLSRKGYLEKFGFLRKISGRRWQVCQLKLPSQDMTIEAQKPLSESNEKISISIPQGERARENRLEKGVSSYSIRRKEEEDTEKDRFSLHKSLESLTPPEQAVLRAEPREEPDRTRVNWGKQSLAIRENEETLK